jgi:hypothetical protein
MVVRFVLATFAFIVLVGWLTVTWLAMRAVNRRIASFESAQPGSTGLFVGVTPVLYAYSIYYWPLSFIVGPWLLRTPSLARQGRLSLIWGFSVGAAFLLAFFVASLVAEF